MALILNIDTAKEYASVCLAKNDTVIAFEESIEQKNHASFIHTAIKKIFAESNFDLTAIDAVAVSNGPGSYTGLRISLATAKGICYSLQKPLITLNTLQIMAYATKKIFLEQNNQHYSSFFICPLIDARRMEVFTAMYNANLQTVVEPSALVLQQDSFLEFLTNDKVVFAGSGVEKLKTIINHTNALYEKILFTAKDMVELSLENFEQKNFADIAYCQPFYLKDVYTTTPTKV